jgi:fructose-1,6-bisphosphatase
LKLELIDPFETRSFTMDQNETREFNIIKLKIKINNNQKKYEIKETNLLNFKTEMNHFFG